MDMSVRVRPAHQNAKTIAVVGHPLPVTTSRSRPFVTGMVK